MYARLITRNTSGLHPNLRGLGAYSVLSTRNRAGLRPEFAGMGDVPATTFAIGPGGQWSISSASTPTSTSIFDQMLTWLGESTVIAGMPNSVLAIGGVVGLLLWKGRRR